MYDLRLAPEVFWRLTPRQLAALCARLRHDWKRQDQHAALVACLIANANRDPKKKRQPFKIEDFMPGEKPEQSPEQQAAILMFASRASKLRRRG